MATAIQAIYRDLEYATTLTRQRSSISSTPFSPTPTTGMADENADDDIGDIEEWTLVSDEEDLDFTKRVRDRADDHPERLFLGD